MSPTSPRLEAWRAVVTTHAAVSARVQTALRAAALPPVAWFETLWAIKHSPSGRPRMSELAESLTFSRGGVTKLVDRLVEAGYLNRIPCTQDRRGLQAELTPTGERIFAEMRAVYRAEVEYQLRQLGPTEAKLVTTALDNVTASSCLETTDPTEKAPRSASR